MTKEQRAMLREAAEKSQKLGQQIDATLQYQMARINYLVASNPATILSLLDALDGAEKDAKRYRWLRDGPEEWDCFSTAWLGGLGIYGDGPLQMDAAIDTLISTVDALPKKESHD